MPFPQNKKSWTFFTLRYLVVYFPVLVETNIVIQKFFIYFNIQTNIRQMKNQHQTLQKDSSSEVRAKKAIQNIQKWMDKRYPVMASVSRSRLIIECLIEINEERRYLTQQ